MSVERFFQESGDSLAVEVKARLKQAKEAGHIMSPVTIAGMLIIEKGREGLLALSQSAGSIATVDLVGLKFQSGNLAVNMAGIFLGATLQTIEEAMVDGCFELDNFGKRIAMGFEGTSYKLDWSPAKGIVMLTDEVRMKMLKAADSDKTLAIFFEQSEELLPEALRNYLENGLPFFREHIIPLYKQRMTSVLEKFRT